MKSPIFIFSQPRSGSTLLQRVLMSHREISSLAEPWILLPLIYAQKPNGIMAEYSHHHAADAMNNFIINLPQKKSEYNDELSKFVLSLYGKQCQNGETYFLDKTPRYYLIIPEIARIFPDAKFIFLYRNPLQVISSIMKTWCNGTLNGLHRYENDLLRGPKLLSEGYEMLKDKSYSLKYEELVTDPEKYLSEICKYLDISMDPKMLENFSKQDTKGRMGDQTGIKKYQTIEKKSLLNWETVFNNKYRIKWVRRYIHKLSEKDLKIMGYDKNELLKSLNKLKVKSLFSINDFILIVPYKFIVRLMLPLFTSLLLKGWFDVLFRMIGQKRSSNSKN